jgi:hypothetical protein
LLVPTDLACKPFLLSKIENYLIRSVNSGFKFAELEISKHIPVRLPREPKLIIYAEILLAVLLSQLRFSLSEKEIHWECGILYNPTVRGISRQPQMPLMVEVVS